MVLRELTSAIVHAARLHEGNSGFDSFGRDNTLSSRGVYSIIGKHGPESGDAFNIDKHRALDKVKVKTIFSEFGRLFKVFELGVALSRQHERSECMVVATGQRLFLVQGEVDVGSLSARRLHVESLKVFHLDFFMNQQGRNQNGPRVDHRVVRPTLFIENRRVKRDARRFLADPSVQLLDLSFRQVQVVQHGVGEHFPDGLNGKLLVVVTELTKLAICAAEGRRKPVRTRLGQGWDVRRHDPMRVLRVWIVLDLGKHFLKIVGKLDILRYDEVGLDHSFQKVICLRKVLKLLKRDAALV